MYIVPGGGPTGQATTTNATSTLIATFDVDGVSINNNSTIILTCTVSGIIQSGLFTGSMGVAQVSRAYKYDFTARVWTPINTLQIVNGLGGVVVLNVAPLIGDLAMVLTSCTLATSGSQCSIFVTGLASTNIKWGASFSVIAFDQ